MLDKPGKGVRGSVVCEEMRREELWRVILLQQEDMTLSKPRRMAPLRILLLSFLCQEDVLAEHLRRVGFWFCTVLSGSSAVALLVPECYSRSWIELPLPGHAH